MSAKTVTLVAGEAATAQDFDAVELGKTPFLPGRKARAIFDSTGSGSAPAYQIDGSADNSTWIADVCDADVVLPGHTEVECTVYKYMRATITTAAGTAGVLSVYLEGLG